MAMEQRPVSLLAFFLCFPIVDVAIGLVQFTANHVQRVTLGSGASGNPSLTVFISDFQVGNGPVTRYTIGQQIDGLIIKQPDVFFEHGLVGNRDLKTCR